MDSIFKKLCIGIRNGYCIAIPSFKVKQDVSFEGEVPTGLRPVSLVNFSFIPPTKRTFMKLREERKRLSVTRSQEKLSVIIPYRHREEHLRQLLPALEKQLGNQTIDYEILVVEQDDERSFNKARLMNVGALNARSDSSYYVFHDVDIIPEEADYTACNYTVRLFSTLIREGEDKLYTDNIFGGVVLVPKDIFYNINGFSNRYVQWGNEDDDFLYRHFFKGHIPLLDTSGRFTELSHIHSLNLDHKGSATKQADILKKNQELRDQNRKIFSCFKRGVLNQDDDGFSSVGNYEINGVENYSERIKILKIRF